MVLYFPKVDGPFARLSQRTITLMEEPVPTGVDRSSADDRVRTLERKLDRVLGELERLKSGREE